VTEWLLERAGETYRASRHERNCRLYSDEGIEVIKKTREKRKGKEKERK